MRESATCLHHLEWPAPGARVRGPVLWLRGWVVGRSGHDFTDVRALAAGGVHLGILGFPRTDLAAHFGAARPWLPAEFVVGVPAADGPLALAVEARDAFGRWHRLADVPVTVAGDGEPSPREEGVLVPRPGGTWTVRGTHRPLDGHFDDPPAGLVHGRAAAFGWLRHERQELRAVFASADLLVFNHLASGAPDAALAARVPGAVRVTGGIDVPPTLDGPLCLRYYAELADGSVHLGAAQRLEPAPDAEPAPTAVPVPFPPAPAPAARAPAALPSGRPRRVLFATRHLEADDATRRALDLARHLHASGRWFARLVTASDGPLRGDFERAGVPVQIVDPGALLAAADGAAHARALAGLGREVWLRHLDAVALFDPVCFWLVPLARPRLPVLLDHSTTEPLVVPDAESPVLAAAMAAAWRGLGLACLAAPSLAAVHADALGAVPLTVVPHWCGPAADPAPAFPGRRTAVAPIAGTARDGAQVLLRAADWLARRHPEVAGRWRLAAGALRGGAEERLFVRDVLAGQPGGMSLDPANAAAAPLCLCPAFARPPVRALLDAAAAGVPLVTTAAGPVPDFVGPHEAAFVPAGNPLALAHAVVDFDADPADALRRADALRGRLRRDHAPAPLLARWQSALESLVTR